MRLACRPGRMRHANPCPKDQLSFSNNFAQIGSYDPSNGGFRSFNSRMIFEKLSRGAITSPEASDVRKRVGSCCKSVVETVIPGTDSARNTILIGAYTA